jgi:DNA-binding MarR family transcriptional regulator
VSGWTVRLRAGEGGTPSHDPSDADAHEFVIEESFGYLVNRLARSMASQLAEELRPAGVGIGQWAVLLFLWARDGMSQAELSRIVAIEPPTMVRTVDRMVRDGLVTREVDQRDARVSRIYLTATGRALRDELVPKAVAVNAANLGRLTAREASELRRLLGKLLEPSLVNPDRSDRAGSPRPAPRPSSGPTPGSR